MTLAEQEGEAPEEDVVELPSRLAVFRVMGLAHGFDDRPPSRVMETAAGPSAGDRLRVTIGDIPSELVDASRARVAWANFMLDATFGGSHRDKSDSELEHAFEQAMESPESALRKLQGDCLTWVTLEVYREVLVHGDRDRVHRWVHGRSDPIALMTRFGEVAAAFLDVAAVRLLPALQRGLKPSQTTYRDPSAYLIAPGKTAIYLPTFSGSGKVTVTSKWESQDWDQVEAAVSRLGYNNNNARLLRTPARWLWSALGEANDDLRRFQFAFLGLEVLTHKVGKRLEAAAGVEVADDEQGVEKRFARVADFFDGAGRWTDKVAFSRLVGKRNDLAHGRATDADLKGVPSHEAVWMLRDYMASVAAAEAAGTLP